MLATNAIPETRINLNARVGVEKQDDTFPPNTADPGLTPAAYLPASGLNSAVQGTDARFARHHGHGLPGQGQRERRIRFRGLTSTRTTASTDATST